ncbi:MAG: ADP-ribosylglycohydrolase family protein [Blastocatellia bacterium]
MSKRIIIAGLLIALAGAAAGSMQKRTHRITRQVLEDKIRGGWAGQMIGVSYGLPTEFKFNGRIIEGEIKWKPEMVSNAISQDDLYVEMTFTEVMDRVGLDATTEQYGEAFKDSKYNLWHANAGARRLLNQGIKAPWSGHPKYNSHANDIDFQIESDFIGMMTPGLPREANKYADRVGRVMAYGDGLYGGLFMGGMYAAAFFESDARKIVEAGLANIPAESGYGRIIRDVLAWSKQSDDWRKTWQLIEDKYNRDDSCPAGALRAFNIDARLNGAYVALGLLHGQGDFTRTLEISTRSGQDSDCNPSSAVGVLGVMLGYSRIPAEWKAGIERIADEKFSFTDYSFNGITASTMRRALKVIEGAGGRISGDEITIPWQAPKAPKLEQWWMGTAQAMLKADDAAWNWKGEWVEAKGRDDERQYAGKAATGAGREAEVTFTGTAFALLGAFGQDGGRADVYLDGARAGTLDAWTPGRGRTNDTALWHAYGLKPGPHRLRIVTRDDADARSTGRRVALFCLISYVNNAAGQL